MTVGFETSSEVELESRVTVTSSVELWETLRLEPGAGVKMAISCSGDVAAVNEVSHVTIEFDDDPAIGTFEQPSIAVPACSKVTAPVGATRRADEVTLAIKMTDAFVAAVPGDVVNRVVVALGVCVSVVNADTWGLTEVSVAVILAVSAVVELLIVAV